MEENGNKIDIETERLLNLARDIFLVQSLDRFLILTKDPLLIQDPDISSTLFRESEINKRTLTAGEDEDRFSRLTKKFDKLKDKLKSLTPGFEDRFVLSATVFLNDLTLTAFDVIEERIKVTYNERLEVQNTLFKILEKVHENKISLIDLNAEVAIALQSVIKQIRTIIQVYGVQLKNEMRKIAKGSYLLEKIEQVQKIIARLNKESVDSEIYMNYEKSLLSTYILTKKIEEGDTLFRSHGFSRIIERVFALLEKEKDIPRLSKEMLLSKYPYSFYEIANHICFGLGKETASICKTIIALIEHFSSDHLPKRNKQMEALQQQNQELFDRERQLLSIAIQSIESGNIQKETQDLVREKSKEIEESVKVHISEKIKELNENEEERFNEGFEEIGLHFRNLKKKAELTMQEALDLFLKKLKFADTFDEVLLTWVLFRLKDATYDIVVKELEEKGYKTTKSKLNKAVLALDQDFVGYILAIGNREKYANELKNRMGN